jgi:hypothetical protein
VRPRPPLNVIITVDTEFSPRDFHAGNGHVQVLVARDIDGITEEGKFGIGFQMDRLEAWGLRAVFQVEAISATAVGPDALRRVIHDVQSRGHDVEMHVHAEWLEAIEHPALPRYRGRNLVSYSEDEQTRILEHGLRNLRDAGASDVRAFRAGNYGANPDTVRAVERAGLTFDTSYNVCYLDPAWPSKDRLLTQPLRMGNVWEMPIGFFNDWPGHFRPAQLCACSSREMQLALVGAWEAGWHSFVIVSHSFELIKRGKDPTAPAKPDRLVIRRMEDLCRFLGENRDRFRVATFSDLDPGTIPAVGTPPPLRSKIGHTVRRMAEQILGRVS